MGRVKWLDLDQMDTKGAADMIMEKEIALMPRFKAQPTKLEPERAILVGVDTGTGEWSSRRVAG
jgi:hypothetical protein